MNKGSEKLNDDMEARKLQWLQDFSAVAAKTWPICRNLIRGNSIYTPKGFIVKENLRRVNIGSDPSDVSRNRPEEWCK
jgi:hypothetical protein